MRVLVTGGAGYSGVKLVERLLGAGYSVTLLDNFMYGYGSVLHLMGHPGLEVLERDIRNVTRQSVAGFDAIYHLAGIVGMPACAAWPHAAEKINFEATRQLVESLDPSQLLIYASTTSLYGQSGQACDESDDVAPVSLYGATKHRAEVIVQQRENSVSLRFATLFGVSPRMRVDLMVNDFAYRAVTDRVLVLFAGRTKRTFIHIDDAVDAYLFVLQHAHAMTGGVFNVGGEDLNHSKLDIAHAIRRHTPFEIVDSAVPDKDPRDFLASFSKIRALGYAPTRSLDDGIKDLLRLYAFYRAHSHFSVI